MSFELYFVVPPERTPPSPDELEAIVCGFPNVEPQESKDPDVLWHYEYLNPETGVVCSFRCKKPDDESIMFRGSKDSGLSYVLPFLCPTFFAREALPLVEKVGKPFDMTIIAPKGERAEPDAEALQKIWQRSNKRTVEIMANSGATMPASYSQERLDNLWHYMNVRHELETRYKAKDIYVPRMIFIRNKLSRNQVFMAFMWTEMSPAVIPDADAIVIGKPLKSFFGLLSSGDVEPVVVRAAPIMKVLEPHLREVDRPIPHRIIENTGRLKKPILRAMKEELTPAFTTFETVGTEEVIDVPT